MGRGGRPLLLALAGWLAALSCQSSGPAPPVYDGPLIPGPPMKTRFGILAHVPHGSDPASAAERSFKLSRARELGVAWVREDFTWAVMETVPGQYDFGPWSALLAAGASSGLGFLPILDYGNPLYNSSSGGDSAYPPTDPTHYANWAGALAGTLGGLSTFEVWNEENAGVRFWKPTLSGDPDAYGTLLCDAYGSLKARQPGSTVVLGGLFGPQLIVVSGGMPFLSGLYAAHPGASACFDALGWHPYRYPFTAPETVSASQQPLPAELDSLQAFLSDHGAAGKRIWITEMGWHTAPQAIYPGVSPLDQARFLVRGALLSISRGAERVFWYDLVDDGPDEATNQESAFGLIGYVANYASAGSFNAKPAFSAYQTLIATLGTSLYAGSVRAEAALPPGDFGFAFEPAGGATRVVALWSSVPGRTATALLPRHGHPSASAVDLFGQPVAVVLVGSNASLGYSESPVYLLLR